MSEKPEPFQIWETPDSGEMAADPDGDPRCPDCLGDLQKCGIDLYRCRKCREGWTITPLP